MMVPRALLLVFVCVLALAWAEVATAQPGSAAVQPPVGPSEKAKGFAYGPRFTDLPIGGPVFEGDPPYGREIVRDARLFEAALADGPVEAIPFGEAPEGEEPAGEPTEGEAATSLGGSGAWNGWGATSEIPEPATLSLVGLGLLGLFLLRRKR